MPNPERKPSRSGRPPRRRLVREERHRQLLDVAWRLVREEGTDALTLPQLSERAGVSKPVVYDHFGTRAGLIAALYREFDARQNAVIEAAIEASAPTLEARAQVIASSYVDCVLARGREIPGVIAALTSSPELQEVKHACETAFMERCRAILAPFAGERGITVAGLRGMLGAAEALSYAAATGEIDAAQAGTELFETIMAMVSRSGQGRSGNA